METPLPENCEAGYRVKKISIRRGYAIDQIKFEYDDHKIWSVGIDGGRKDNRDFIMTPGEYLVRVTHETLRQRSVSSLSFHPRAVRRHLQVVRRGLGGVRDQQGESRQLPALLRHQEGRRRHHTQSGARQGNPEAEDKVRIRLGLSRSHTLIMLTFLSHKVLTVSYWHCLLPRIESNLMLLRHS